MPSFSPLRLLIPGLFGALAAASACSGGTPEEEPGGNPGIGGGGGERGCEPIVDTTAYDYDLNLARSADPPGGLSPSEVPQFVALGWDDNGFLASFDWAREMLAARGVKSTFLLTTTYISDGSVMFNPDPLRESWRAAYDAGHEIGNHTQYHRDGQPPSLADGTPFDGDTWRIEIETAFDWLGAPLESEDPEVDLGLGIPRNEIYGFRSPFLHYNDELFEELRDTGIWYDCSIEEGWDLSEDASSFPWPYTLDEGSAGHDYAEARDFESRNFSLSAHPGIIELPAYALQIPGDDLADDYNIEPGLLERIREVTPPQEPGSDRIVGLDFNLWYEAQLSKEEVLAILKFNLDQRLNGNRAPFLFGVHTDFYRDSWPPDDPNGPPPGAIEDFERRREAIDEFLDYATSLPEVRVVTFKEVVDFMRDPRSLDCY